MNQGSVLALAGRASDAIEMLISGITAFRTTGSTSWLPLHLLRLARAHAELGQFEEAWRCIGEAMTAAETTKQTWCEAEVHSVAGEVWLRALGMRRGHYRITGIALGWIGSTTAFGAVVRKPYTRYRAVSQKFC
jgi:hypothetical protein